MVVSASQACEPDQTLSRGALILSASDNAPARKYRVWPRTPLLYFAMDPSTKAACTLRWSPTQIQHTKYYTIANKQTLSKHNQTPTE